MEEQKIKYVIFDLGGVLIDWNPAYLYEKVFQGDPDKMDWFLKTVCTQQWNVAQDEGRTLEAGTNILIKAYPEYESEIRMFYGRWEEMLKGEIKDTVMILKELKQLNKVKLYALTNWSAETFPIAKRRFDLLNLFEGIVVSGDELTIKPFPKIYNILLERYQLEAKHCVFIDDSLANTVGSEEVGIKGIHFKNPKQLRADLQKLNVLPS